MAGRTGWLTAVLAILGCGSGCISPSYYGVKLAQDAGPTCEVPLEDRNEVYVFIVGGNNPLEMMALDRFREGINAGGYSKAASGPAVYSSWMASEMKRIHTGNPNAVFLIAGLESSAQLGVKLSEKAVADGIPVRGLVVVDASNKTAPPAGVRTLVVGTGPNILGLTAVDPLVIEAPGRLGLAAEIRTIEQTVRLLNEIAIGNSSPPPAQPATDWAYPFATDVLTSLEQRPESEWGFMFDQPGGMTRAIDSPLPQKTLPTSGNTAVR